MFFRLHVRFGRRRAGYRKPFYPRYQGRNDSIPTPRRRPCWAGVGSGALSNDALGDVVLKLGLRSRIRGMDLVASVGPCTSMATPHRDECAPAAPRSRRTPALLWLLHAYARRSYSAPARPAQRLVMAVRFRSALFRCVPTFYLNSIAYIVPLVARLVGTIVTSLRAVRSACCLMLAYYACTAPLSLAMPKAEL